MGVRGGGRLERSRFRAAQAEQEEGDREHMHLLQLYRLKTGERDGRWHQAVAAGAAAGLGGAPTATRGMHQSSQKALDREPIHVVKPRVLTNARERARMWAGRGMLGMTDTDPPPGGVEARLTFCRRHGGWQRGRGGHDKAVKWK